MVKEFPLQTSDVKEKIDWDIAERIYKAYSHLYGTNQSLERLAERGGFGNLECMWILLRYLEQKYDDKLEV